MVDQTPTWGPEFSQYSSHQFDLQAAPTVPYDYITAFYQKYQVAPLVALWSMLYRLIDLLQRYTIVNGHSSVFKNYYGFLCVRYLIHITCLAVLKGTNTLDQLLGSLRKNASWSEMSQALSFAALDRFAEASRGTESLEEFYRILTYPSLVLDDLLGKANVSILAYLLWESRDMFLVLCSRGLLPGCALLLLMVSKSLTVGSREEERDVLYLQDLAFRSYLVGSRRDQEAVQPVCLLADEKKLVWPPGKDRGISSEDSHRLAQAYIDLFAVRRREKTGAKGVSIGVMSHLTGFVQNIFESDYSMTSGELMDLASTAHQFLWLILEQNGRLSADDHIDVRKYALLCLVKLRSIRERFTPTPGLQYKFAKLVANTEVVSLAGRLLLLTTDEGNEFEDPDWIELTLGQLVGLKDLLAAVVHIAPDLFYDSKLEWVKVMAHAELPIQMGMGGPRDEGNDISRLVSRTLSTWALFESSLGDEATVPQECAYPRCCWSVEPKMGLGIRYKCGRCDIVTYCSPNCQHAHWRLATSESHRLVCSPSSNLVKQDEP
ncbi:hypothetical protein FRC08_005456 [Ceratobasidium sp. 394]|nr:hypothetical protein FRC08_005456 [Ceratobasidium sp. 394]